MNQEEKKYFIHESSFIDQNVEIGKGTKIWHFCHILQNSKIGKDCSLGQNVMVGPNVQVGDSVKIQNNVSVYDGVTLEDNVFCGPSAVFTNVINPRSNVNVIPLDSISIPRFTPIIIPTTISIRISI